MDNLTHTLYGVALARTGLDRLAPRATATLIIGAIFPDIDVISLFRGSINYLKYHRGFTHSLLGIPVGALVLATAIYFIHNRLLKKGESVPWWKYFLLASIGVSSHVLLDFTNSYGLRLFSPFSARWYAGDIVFIVDPWILGALVLTLGLPFFFGLINQEIGARKREHRTSAILCLLLIAAYWGAKVLSHHQSIVELAQSGETKERILSVGAIPQPLSPFKRYGIVETENSYIVTQTGWDMIETMGRTVRPRVFHKSDETSILQAVHRGPEAQVFLDFSRYPLFSVIPTNLGYSVTVRDLRFQAISQQRRNFVLTVELGRDLHLVSEAFNF
jgi:inner membrane protein